MTDTPNRGAEDVGSEARREVEDAAGRLKDDTTATAREAMDSAKREADATATRTKDGVADEMSGIASALRTAAREMREGSPQERTFGQIAESLADASDGIRDRDMGEIASDVSSFARRNPMAFLGGAALAGFAAVRFAKAGTSPRPSGSSDRGYSSDADAPVPAPRATTQPAAAPARPTGSSPAQPSGTATTLYPRGTNDV